MAPSQRYRGSNGPLNSRVSFPPKNSGYATPVAAEVRHVDANAVGVTEWRKCATVPHVHN
jgi:hypothetical protein